MNPSPRYGTVDGVRALLDRDVAEAEAGEGEQQGEGVDVSDTAAALSRAVLVERLNTAASQVDSSLAPYYPGVPFEDDVPQLVVDLTEAIAAYLATLTHLQSGSLEDDDPVRLRYEWATGQLEAIAKGTAGIPGVPRTVVATAGSGTVLQPRNPYAGRMFTADTFGLVGGGGPGRDGWNVR